MAAGLLFLIFLFAMTGHSSATWCVCKDGPDATLQKTLDYACGAGADCNPTHDKGPCFNPNTVRSHCSYAVNSYFQKNKQLPTACDFSGTAQITTTDPSASSSCAYPATATSATTTNSPGTTTSVPGTAGGNTISTNPGSGVLGGSGNGLGPSGYNDMSDGVRIQLSNTAFVFFCSIVLTFSALVFS